MATERASETEDLWRRVGLEELRQALGRVHELADRFEHVLGALPPCSQCARVKLLEAIRTTGGELSSESASLSVLAGSLTDATRALEASREQLCAEAPEPCRCQKRQRTCACHD